MISWITKWPHHKNSVFYWMEEHLCSRIIGSATEYSFVTTYVLVNNIVENIPSQLTLFADDCLLYQLITVKLDTVGRNLYTLTYWADIWPEEL